MNSLNKLEDGVSKYRVMSDSVSPPPSPPTSKPRKGRWLLPLLILPFVGGGLGLVGVMIAVSMMPKKYESVAMLQFHFGPAWDISVETLGKELERFIRTEFETIRSLDSMERVAVRLDLASRWEGLSEEEILGALKNSVEVEQVRGADLIRVRVRHESPEDARDIAQAVAETYTDHCKEVEIRRAEIALDALDAELREQEDRVEEKRKVLHTIMRALGIPNLDGRTELGQDVVGLLDVFQKEQYEMEREKDQLKTQIKTLLRLNAEEMIRYAAGLNFPDNGVPNLHKQYQREVRALEGLRASGLDANHPEVKEKSAAVEQLKTELIEAVVALRDILQTQLELVEGRLAEMERSLAKRRGDALDKALKARDYVEAKRDYEKEQHMREAMELAHSGKRIALKIPRTPVTIHEKPRLASEPVEPQVMRMGAIGLLGGGALGFLVAIPIAGLMLVRGLE